MSIKIRLREIKTSPDYPQDLPNFPHPSEHFFYRPYLNDNQTLMILDLLDRLRPEKCLEWGAGWSTVFFPRFVPEAKWISIEHRPFWVETLTPHLLPNTVLIQKSNWKDYTNEGLNWIQGQPFDFAFVDGEVREWCIKIASAILREGGVVVKHDSPEGEVLIHDGEDVKTLFREQGIIQGLWWGVK